MNTRRNFKDGLTLLIGAAFIIGVVFILPTLFSQVFQIIILREMPRP